MRFITFLIILCILFLVVPTKIIAAIILIGAGLLSLAVLIFAVIACLLGS